MINTIPTYKKLSGNSGNEVFQYKNSEGIKVVKKIATNDIQNVRLQRQYSKHKYLYSLQNSLFSIPEILNSGFENNYFYYEYKYVEGKVLIALLQNNDVKTNKIYLDKIILIIKYFAGNPNYLEKEYEGLTLRNVLEEKITSNCQKLNIDSGIKNICLEYLKLIDGEEKKTLNHGDLTFDNIIIGQDKKLYLIDYLDFYPHYWLDIAKLFQDIEGAWFEIKHKIKIDRKKTNSLSNYLKEQIIDWDEEYLKKHNFLMATVFLRILPYLQNETDKNKILLKIKAYINALIS